MRFHIKITDDGSSSNMIEVWSKVIGEKHVAALVAAKSQSACVAALGALRERVTEADVERSIDTVEDYVVSKRGIALGGAGSDARIIAQQLMFEPLVGGIRIARSTAHVEDALFSSYVARDLPRRFELVHECSGHWEHSAYEPIGRADGWPTYSITTPNWLPYGPSFISWTAKVLQRDQARSVAGMSQHRQVFSVTSNDDPEPFYVGVTGGRMYGQNGKPLRGLAVSPIHLALVKRQARAEGRWWFATFDVDGRSVSLVTQPRHASILFASRDKVPPARRRAALVHWVRAHRRSLGHADVSVVSYLRGVREFSWNGFNVRLDPASQGAP